MDYTTFTEFGLSSIWMSLSLLNKIFFLYFCGVSVYTFGVSLNVLLRLRSLRGQLAEAKISVESEVPTLRLRLSNLRQLHLFTLYLFGLCSLSGIMNAFATLGASKTYPLQSVIAGLSFRFYCDAVIFLGFLMIHTVQWIASGRLESFANRKE